jgi:dihydroxy-acid dehydratase
VPPRGYRRLFAERVLQAPEGCDFDFLAAAGRGRTVARGAAPRRP